MPADAFQTVCIYEAKALKFKYLAVLNERKNPSTADRHSQDLWHMVQIILLAYLEGAATVSIRALGDSCQEAV